MIFIVNKSILHTQSCCYGISNINKHMIFNTFRGKDLFLLLGIMAK